MSYVVPSSVLVTGAGGNLGRKLVEALAATSWCRRIVGLDLAIDPGAFSSAAASRLTPIRGDLAQAGAPWMDSFGSVEAVVHLAAQNPNVDATWDQATTSFDMTCNVASAAMRHGLPRIVFASSNHVMGRYKDAPLADTLRPGSLTTALSPAPGTRWHDGTSFQDSTAYATAKLMGERLMKAVAASGFGTSTTVSIRVGWTQPGNNEAATISHAGSTIGGFPVAETEHARRDLRWFRNMWLSNADYASLFLAALTADPASWPTPGIVVNGMSANRDMDWSLDGAIDLLGYAPRHDLYAEI